MKRWWIKLMHHARPPARSLASIALLLVAGRVLDALKPWPIKLLVDHVLRPIPTSAAKYRWLDALPGAGSPTVLIGWLAASAVVLYLAAQLVRIAQSYLQSGLGSRIAYSLGGRLLERMQELSLVFHSQRRVADLVRRVVTDSGCVRDLVCGVMIPAAAALTSLVVMFAIMVRIDAGLSFIAISFAVPLAVLIRIFSAPMARRSYEQQNLEGQMLSLAEQTLGAVPVVQTFGREPEQDRQFRGLVGKTLKACIRAMVSQLQFKIGTSSVTAIGTASIMVVGGMHVLDGKISIGDLLVFLAYLASLYAPLETLAYLAMGYAAAAAGARRVLEVLESGERVIEKAYAVPLVVPSSARGLDISFEAVTFGYVKPSAVLHRIDLSIPAGQVVALVGPTGAGKSTLASLVPRLLDPWQGQIRIDGRDLRDLKLASLREQVAIVPQEPLLLPLSVAENIAYAKPSATMAQISQAATAAGAAEFIDRMPDGYRSVLGERGLTLSAGQRQRLSIARALLKDAPVLILDEPTSALDAATEHSVVEALARLMAGRTCLIIAHRLSTIRHADVVVVLEHGRIVQQGPHDKLLARDGLYKRLHRFQAGLPVLAEGAAPVPGGVS